MFFRALYIRFWCLEAHRLVPPQWSQVVSVPITPETLRGVEEKPECAAHHCGGAEHVDRRQAGGRHVSEYDVVLVVLYFQTFREYLELFEFTVS